MKNTSRNNAVAELLQAGVHAAIAEAEEQKGRVKLQLGTICQLYGVAQTDEGIAQLPAEAQTMALALVEEYKTWQAANHLVHMTLADLRRDAMREGEKQSNEQ